MLGLREQFWSCMAEIKHKEAYYLRYQERSRKIDRWITALCGITTATSVATWAMWLHIPWLWSLLIATSQLVQALKPHIFPYSEQLVALKFFLPSASQLLIQAEFEWNGIDNRSDEEIRELVREYQLKIESLENKYRGDTWFTPKTHIADRAEEDRDQYLSKFRRSDTNGAKTHEVSVR